MRFDSSNLAAPYGSAARYLGLSTLMIYGCSVLLKDDNIAPIISAIRKRRDGVSSQCMDDVPKLRIALEGVPTLRDFARSLNRVDALPVAPKPVTLTGVDAILC